jgi:hypothetical protein
MFLYIYIYIFQTKRITIPNPLTLVADSKTLVKLKLVKSLVDVGHFAESADPPLKGLIDVADVNLDTIASHFLRVAARFQLSYETLKSM